MNRIWAPWRKAYIRPKEKKEKSCLFCRLLKSPLSRKSLIVGRNPLSYAVLNRYPYNNGHILIVPNRHVSEISDLTDREKLDWLSLQEEVLAALRKTLKPHGVNLGINLGRVAGAGIPGHLHLHMVPRWQGDVNFMPVVGATKVISESLESVWEVLSGALKNK